MEYRRLGRTGLEVSLIGVGGGPYRGPDIEIDQVAEIARVARAAGVNFFETAEDYDEGKMGWGLRGIRSEVVLATKNTESGYAAMKRGIEKSLSLLRTDYIDIYQLHYVNSAGELLKRIEGGALKALEEARSAGRIGFIGLSGHHIPTLIQAIELDHFDLVQIPYHLGHCKAEKLFPVALRRDVGVIAMKTLGGGFMVDPALQSEVQRPGAERMKVGRCIRHVVARTEIASALVGFRAPAQVGEVVEAAKDSRPLDDEEARRIHEEVRAFLGDDYCRTCKYCAPCAVHGWDMDIDGILRMEGFYRNYGYMRSAIEAYGGLRLKADACIRCGTCVARCPYEIDIPARLAEAHALFTAGSFHLAGELARGARLEEAAEGLRAVENEVASIREESRRAVERYRLWEGSERKEQGGRDEVIRLEAIARIQEILVGARRAMEAGSVDQAMEQYGEGEDLLRAADDGSRVIAHYLDLCMFMKKRCREACGEVEEAISRGREVEALARAAKGDAASLKDLSDLFMRHGEYEGAMGYLRKAIEVCGAAGGGVEELDPLWGSLVRWHREQGRYDEAIEFVEGELSRHPGEPGLLFHRGECLMEKGDYENAIYALREVVAGRPEMNWAHFSLGKCLYMVGNYREAMEAFETNIAVCQDPLSHFHSWYFKAMAHLRMRNRGEAKACLERASGYREFSGRCEIPEEKAFLQEFEQESEGDE